MTTAKPWAALRQPVRGLLLRRFGWRWLAQSRPHGRRGHGILANMERHGLRFEQGLAARIRDARLQGVRTAWQGAQGGFCRCSAQRLTVQRPPQLLPSIESRFHPRAGDQMGHVAKLDDRIIGGEQDNDRPGWAADHRFTSGNGRRARRGCGFRSGFRGTRRCIGPWRVDRELVRFGTGSRPVEIDPLAVGAALAPQGGSIGDGQEAHGEQENGTETKKKASAEAVQAHSPPGSGGTAPRERCSPGDCRDSRFRRATVFGEFSAHGVSIASPRFPCRALRSAAKAYLGPYTAHTLLIPP